MDTPSSTARLRRSGTVLLVATVLALGLLVVQSAEPTSASARVTEGLRMVPPGKTVVLIGQGTEPNVVRSMSGYDRRMPRRPAGYTFYLILSGDLQRTRQDISTMNAFLARRPGAAVNLALGYGPDLTGNNKETGYLLAGVYDDELDAVAQWLRSTARPVFLRPLYEFDRACDTYGPPDLYVSAYRYVEDRIKLDGAGANVSWVWQSAGPGFRLDRDSLIALSAGISHQLGIPVDQTLIGGPELPVSDVCPIADFFPGPGYVDYFAVSYWADGSLTGRSTRQARMAYDEAVGSLFEQARALGLGLMIAESTPAYVGTNHGRSSRRWFAEYFRMIEKYDVSVISYINSPWAKEGGVWGSPLLNGFFPADARIQPYRGVRDVWNRHLRDPRYVMRAGLGQIFPSVTSSADLPWDLAPEPARATLRWPNCPLPLTPGTGGWCLPLVP